MSFDPSKIDLSNVDPSKHIPLDDQEKKALQSMIKQAIEEGGDEMLEMIDSILLPFELKYEAYLREHCPGHPSIARLDEYHKRKEMGLE